MAMAYEVAYHPMKILGKACGSLSQRVMVASTSKIHHLSHLSTVSTRLSAFHLTGAAFNRMALGLRRSAVVFEGASDVLLGPWHHEVSWSRNREDMWYDVTRKLRGSEAIGVAPRT